MESEETHDIYAWTTVWNGKDRPVFNCTKDPAAEGAFESHLGGPGDRINLETPWTKEVIYFFGEKS